MKYFEKITLAVSLLLGIKQNPKPVTRQIYLGDGRRVTVLMPQEKKSIKYSVIPEDRMNHSDWVVYVKLRNDVDCEGSVIVKHYL